MDISSSTRMFYSSKSTKRPMTSYSGSRNPKKTFDFEEITYSPRRKLPGIFHHTIKKKKTTKRIPLHVARGTKKPRYRYYKDDQEYGGNLSNDDDNLQKGSSSDPYIYNFDDTTENSTSSYLIGSMLGVIKEEQYPLQKSSNKENHIHSDIEIEENASTGSKNVLREDFMISFREKLNLI